MATATIDRAAWAGLTAFPRTAELKVQSYSLARCRGAFLAAELMLVALALLLVSRGRHSLGALIPIVSCAVAFHINNLDRSIVSSKSSPFCIDLLESLSLGFLASALVFYAFPGSIPRVGIALASTSLIALLPFVLRLFLRHLVNSGRLVEEVLIVGTGDLPAKLHRALGCGIGHANRKTRMLSLSGVAGRGGTVDLTELSQVVVRDQISRVVIAELDPLTRERLAAALLDSRLRGLRIDDAVDFFEECRGKIWVEALNPRWFVYSNGFNRSQTGMRLKRCFDVTFATLLILGASPLLALIAIAIKLDSAGPTLFRQARVGLHGRTFVIYKFRSMRHDAELDTGPVWTAVWDPRVTKVGRLLRLFRLDELPQAFNVLKGDMSMVGPRPERPCFVKELDQRIPFYSLRHYLKPGITGWAQVMYRYGASIEDAYEKLQYDFYYAKHKSFRCDATILLKTVRIVLFGRGR
jgi:sugar transferase (PEP-CTERM system associated)